MGERMCRSSHLLLPSSIPSLSWSREGMKRIVKRRKEFNGIREACRGQGSMPEIRSTAIVPRFRGNKTISASVSLPFLSASPFQLIEQLEKDDRHLEREKGIMNFCLLPSSYYFALFKISSSISVCNSFSNKSGVFCSWNFLVIRRGIKL